MGSGLSSPHVAQACSGPPFRPSLGAGLTPLEKPDPGHSSQWLCVRASVQPAASRLGLPCSHWAGPCAAGTGEAHPPGAPWPPDCLPGAPQGPCPGPPCQ